MVLQFRFPPTPDLLELEVASFEAFESWLWGLGAGMDLDYPERRAWWAGLYRELLGEVFRPSVIALARSDFGRTVVIVGRKDAPPRA